jgi:hypothetical protein
MTQIIPNTQAVPQVIGSSPVVVNGTDHQWLANEIMHGIKVLHVFDYSFSAEETGGSTAELKLSLQRDLGSGWEDVPGEGAAMTFTAGQDRRFRLLCKVPYYSGIDAGVLPKYRLVTECPNGQVTLHIAEGSEGVPSGQWKAEYEFEGEEPGEVVIIEMSTESDWTTLRPTTWPVLNNYTNKFFANLGDGRFATMFRGDGVSEAYEILVWRIDGIDLDGVPVVSASTNQFAGGSNLGDYLNSIFIATGTGKAVSSWQNFGVIRAYIVDAGGGLSVTEYQPGADYPIPGAYDDCLNCSRAAVTYVPATDKVIFLMQLGSGDYQPYTRSSTLGGDGAFINHDISAGNPWDATVEYVDVESRICSGAVGDDGGFVYVANLFDNSNRRISFIHQNVDSSGNLSAFTETNFTIDSYGYTWQDPVALIGDQTNDRFVVLMSSGSLLFAMLCTVSDGSVTTNIPLQLGDYGQGSGYGSGIWVENSDYLILQTSDNNNVYYIVLDASGELAITDSITILNEGDGAYFGQINHDPSHDFFASCYNEDQTAADNNKHRMRVVRHKGNKATAITSGAGTSVSVPLGVSKFYKITSSSTHTALTVTLTGLTADVNLYVRAGAVPTSGEYDDASLEAGTTDEQCDLVNSGVTTWYIAVDGYEAGSCTLTATLS